VSADGRGVVSHAGVGMLGELADLADLAAAAATGRLHRRCRAALR
jgi:hypothetical protein